MEITLTKVKKVEETSKYEIPEEFYKKDCLEIYHIKVENKEVRIKSIYFASYGNSFEVKNIKAEKLEELLQLKDATSEEWLKAIKVAVGFITNSSFLNLKDVNCDVFYLD